jgi:hypothetical protein
LVLFQGLCSGCRQSKRKPDVRDNPDVADLGCGVDPVQEKDYDQALKIKDKRQKLQDKTQNDNR